jgi:hypothetical protein
LARLLLNLAQEPTGAPAVGYLPPPEREGVAHKEHLDRPVYSSLVSSKGIKFALTNAQVSLKNKNKRISILDKAIQPMWYREHIPSLTSFARMGKAISSTLNVCMMYSLALPMQWTTHGHPPHSSSTVPEQPCPFEGHQRYACP